MQTEFKIYDAQGRDHNDLDFQNFLYRYKLLRTLEFRSDTFWQHIKLLMQMSGKTLDQLLEDFESMPRKLIKDVKEVLDDFSYEGEAEHGTYIGLYKGEKLIGGSFFMPRAVGTGQVHQIAVYNAYRRMGLGSLLMEELERVMLDHGHEITFAHARTYLNEFYSKLGYTLIPESDWDDFKAEFALDTTHQIGIPHILMRKDMKN